MDKFRMWGNNLSKEMKEHFLNEYIKINNEIITENIANHIKPLLQSGYNLDNRISCVLYKDMLNIKVGVNKNKYTNFMTGYALPIDVFFYDWYPDNYKLTKHLKINNFQSFKPKTISTKIEGSEIIEEFMITLPRIADVVIIVNMVTYNDIKGIVLTSAIDYSYLKLKHS